MAEHNKHIDDLYRERLQDYEEAPRELVWDKIEAGLNKVNAPNNSGFSGKKLWYALAALVLVGTVGYFSYSHFNKSAKNTNITIAKDQKQNIENIDKANNSLEDNSLNAPTTNNADKRLVVNKKENDQAATGTSEPRIAHTSKQSSETIASNVHKAINEIKDNTAIKPVDVKRSVAQNKKLEKLHKVPQQNSSGLTDASVETGNVNLHKKSNVPTTINPNDYRYTPKLHPSSGVTMNSDNVDANPPAKVNVPKESKSDNAIVDNAERVANNTVAPKNDINDMPLGTKKTGPQEDKRNSTSAGETNKDAYSAGKKMSSTKSAKDVAKEENKLATGDNQDNKIGKPNSTSQSLGADAASKKNETNSGDQVANSQTSPDNGKDHKKLKLNITGGVKVGYEKGFGQYAANKLTGSGYIKFSPAKRISIVIQPGIQYNNLSTTVSSGTEYYVDNVVKHIDSTAASTGSLFFYHYYETYDSIIVRRESTSSSYIGFEMPITFNYQLTPKISVLGGVSISFSKTFSVGDVVTNQAITGPKYEPPNKPNKPQDIDSFLNAVTFYHSAGPYTPGSSTDASSKVRIGYILGVGYKMNDKFFIEMSATQTISDMGYITDPNVKGIYTQPYFRLSLGYNILSK